MLEKLPHKPEVLTEEQVRNILNELKSYRDKKIEFKNLSLAAKKMMHNSDQYLNTTIESLEKECKIFDDVNKKFEEFETLSKEKIKLEQDIATLESEYQTLDNDHERRDRAGGGARAEYVAKEMIFIDEQIKDLKEKLESLLTVLELMKKEL
jgi:cell division protein FtsB